MHYDLILKNGTLVTPEKTFRADIAVKDEKIAFVGSPDAGITADEIYDAEGKHILPGLIDAHVHFRDPGFTEKEDFESGSMAAAFGGITFVADMPNTLPVTSTPQRLKEKVNIASEKSYIDFGIFALLPGKTCEMEELIKAGALGFKVFLGTSTGDIACPPAGVLVEQMQAAAELGIRIGFHAENTEINSHYTSLCMKMSNNSGKSGEGQLLAQARPVISEALAIQNVICLAQYTGAKIHIHHITSLYGTLLIEEAKEKGVNLTVETCPHYLFLDANMPKAHKVYPPVRDEIHRRALWDALDRGVIDMIASDHAPHTAAEKAQPIWEAPGGLCGVETTVRLLLNEVNRGQLTLNDFVRLLSEAPAKIWDIYPKKGSLLHGADADFTVIDMNRKSKISINELHSKSRTCVYDGIETQGMPAATIVRGKFIMKDGCLTGKKGYGALISPVL